MRRLLSALIMMLALVVGSAGVGGWWFLNRTAPAWAMVIQRADGSLVLADGGGKQRTLTLNPNDQRVVYIHPTPAPDGRSVAMVAVTHDGNSTSAQLEVYTLNRQRTTLYQQPADAPFYLSWSPDSQKIAFLTGSQSGMTLHVAAADGKTAAKRIAPGQPSYFSWSPDSQRLLVHIGGRAPLGTLQLYDWNAAEPQQLALEPGLFQAPRWHPDGQRAFVIVQDASAAKLVLINGQGNVVQQIAGVSEATVFVPAPNADQIAYFSLAGASAGQLHLLNADGANNRTITSADPVVTCFWSPDGSQLAFLSIVTDSETKTISTRQEAIGLRWNVVRVADGSVRKLETFRPSAEFLNLLPFFDQYAQSIRLWDKTGTRLLYASTDGVWTLDVRSGEATRVGEGVLAFWMEQ